MAQGHDRPGTQKTPNECLVHATTVAWKNTAVMITGPSGSGKSGLALQLISFGLTLVADDQTRLERNSDDHIIASAPATIRGTIEARGIGLLAADTVGRARLALVIDMQNTETARMPEPRTVSYLGTEIPLLHKVESCHFPAAVLQYLKGGRTFR